MEIVALVGKSGTGKSFKVMKLSKDLGVDYIIDDGILIKGNALVEGKSAKSESSVIKAVKRAIFLDKDHRKKVKSSISKYCPKKLLILGTSENMINRIIRNLDLGKIGTIINIEDISSKNEINDAKRSREREGKHIIPLPTFEIKKDFSGYFLEKIYNKSKREIIEYENTVVRPTFSYRGNYRIRDKVIKDIVKYIVSTIESVDRAYNVVVEGYKDGIVISMDLIIFKGYIFKDIYEQTQRIISRDVNYMTGLNILEINLNIVKIKLKKAVFK